MIVSVGEDFATLDIDKVQTLWCDQCELVQWNNEYSLCFFYDRLANGYESAKITQEQAFEVIEKLGLTAYQSPLFIHKKNWVKNI